MTVQAPSTTRVEEALDRAAPFVLAATIVAAAAGSSIERHILDAGRPARWVLLAALAVFSGARAAVSGPVWRLRPAVVLLLASFCALSLVSAAWSANVHSTLSRGAAQLVVVGSVAALAGCVPSRPALAERLLDGVLAGIAAVALASVGYWLATRSGAYQPVSTQYPSRFRGIEQNPNTVAMILAVGMPIALARLLEPGRRRLAYAALFVLLAVEIVLSGSRGGLLAGFLGAAVVAALLPLRGRLRGVIALAVVAGLFVAAWASTLPKALPASAAPAVAPPAKTVGIDAERVLPLMGEIGNPWWTDRSRRIQRRFFDTSVRMRALEGSFQRARQRPLLGWGYGAELEAFTSRYYGFASQNPENGYVGILLQLGLLGLLLFLAAVGSCLATGARACLRRPTTAGAAAVGAASAGLLLGLSQSYFHGPGNVAFVAVWMSLLLASVADATRLGAPR